MGILAAFHFPEAIRNVLDCLDLSSRAGCHASREGNIGDQVGL
jgi:hypothetical protein